MNAAIRKFREAVKGSKIHRVKVATPCGSGFCFIAVGKPCRLDLVRDERTPEQMERLGFRDFKPAGWLADFSPGFIA